MQNFWTFAQRHESLPLVPSGMNIRVLRVTLRHKSTTLCQVNHNAQAMPSPHNVTWCRNPCALTTTGGSTTIRMQWNIMLTHCYWCRSSAPDDGKHRHQLATAQVPLQSAPLTCGDVELTSHTAKIFPAYFMFSIKNIRSSSHKKLNNGLFTLARIISTVEIT